LIFDEATSAIDVRGEPIVQEALHRVAKNRTTITIAHRFSTIKKADKIIVLSKDKAVEQGTHEELVRKDAGVYHILIRGQQLSMESAKAGAPLKQVACDPLSSDGMEAGNKADMQATEFEEVPYKKRGIFRGGFLLLLLERRSHALWLAFTLFGSLGGGGKCSCLVRIPTNSYGNSALCHFKRMFLRRLSRYLSLQPRHWFMEASTGR
jgi:hypothetical protein